MALEPLNESAIHLAGRNAVLEMLTGKIRHALTAKGSQAQDALNRIKATMLKDMAPPAGTIDRQLVLALIKGYRNCGADPFT